MQLRTTDDGGLYAALFAEHNMSALHVAFSLDGECLASGDLDEVACIRHLSQFIGD